MNVVVGDCLDVAGALRCVFEAAVMDPPSGIGFMGLRFDLDHGGEDRWVAYFAERLAAVREACIPGAYGLFWSLPRTSDWTMQACRRAGWRVVDKVAHVFGQGWPKGRGQLKPAREDWILCRDPRGKVRDLNIDGCRVARSYAERPESWFRSGHSAKPDAAKISGAPAGNGIHAHEGGSWPPNLELSHVGACRCVGSRTVKGSAPASGPTLTGSSTPLTRGRFNGVAATPSYGEEQTIRAWECLAACECGLASLSPAGGAPSPCPGCSAERWWACPVAEMDWQSGTSTSTDRPRNNRAPNKLYGEASDQWTTAGFADSGGGSRFFPTFVYDAKAARLERQAGCEHLLWVRDKDAPIGWRLSSAEEHAATSEQDRARGNVHATIKPIGAGEEDGLMRRHVRLVTPEGGPVFDGTMGSGGTGIACQIEGRDFTGCDIDPGAVAIAQARLAFWTPERHRQVLHEREAARALERARQREEAAKAPRHDDLPLFGRRAP